MMTLGVLLAATLFYTKPINDLGPGYYLGRFQGGLYENGSNVVPADHDSDGRSIDHSVLPINNGKSSYIVLLSIGMSTANAEFQQFISQRLNCVSAGQCSTKVFAVNGAQAGYAACAWTQPYGSVPPSCHAPSSNPYDNIAKLLSGTKYSPSQVEVIWMDQADYKPSVSLPSSHADAYTLEGELGQIARAAKVRYPNLKMIFMSGRIYGGYDTTGVNREPYAFENGFAFKWLIQAQINQRRTGKIGAIAGNLSYAASAWLAWSYYDWAAGPVRRSDGLIWCNGQDGSPCDGEEDYRRDGLHPNTPGSNKVASGLLQFFKTSPYTTWFVK